MSALEWLFFYQRCVTGAPLRPGFTCAETVLKFCMVYAKVKPYGSKILIYFCEKLTHFAVQKLARLRGSCVNERQIRVSKFLSVQKFVRTRVNKVENLLLLL